jgi:membrane protein involved in colicin uptake
MRYEDKIKLIRSKLGLTPAERLAKQFASHTKHIGEVQRKKDEQEKAHKQAEAERKAAIQAQGEQERLNKKKAEEAQEARRQAQLAKQIAESEARADREKKAREWVDAMKWEYIYWERRKNKAVVSRQAFREPEPINPLLSWFDSNYFIKPQFKEYYHE